MRNRKLRSSCVGILSLFQRTGYLVLDTLNPTNSMSRSRRVSNFGKDLEDIARDNVSLAGGIVTLSKFIIFSHSANVKNVRDLFGIPRSNVPTL